MLLQYNPYFTWNLSLSLFNSLKNGSYYRRMGHAVKYVSYSYLMKTFLSVVNMLKKKEVTNFWLCSMMFIVQVAMQQYSFCCKQPSR
jgi:hypothetical protein